MSHICDLVGDRVTNNNMTQKKMITFADLGISKSLAKILTSKKIINPTKIQEKCISFGLNNKDIIGIAQTGTGKTLAFGLPIIEKIRKTKGKCLILAPTRELADQIYEVMTFIGQPFDIKTALLIGGVSAVPQKKALSRNPQILIATPGRLIDHLHRENCRLDNITTVVLDEADRMLDIGFMPQINEILKTVPKKRQTLLFSATMPPAITKLSNNYMLDPVKIEIAPSGTSAEKIHQEIFIVPPENKQNRLNKIAKNTKGKILVFTRTKFKAKKVAKVLRKQNISAVEIHSNRSVGQRNRALEGFKSGKFQVMVATDVAARGIDVKDISLVINFDLPEDAGDYVHRIGRTGRAGKNGKAISFVEPRQNYKLKKIEKLIKKNITITSGKKKLNKKNTSKSRNHLPSRIRRKRKYGKYRTSYNHKKI